MTLEPPDLPELLWVANRIQVLTWLDFTGEDYDRVVRLIERIGAGEPVETDDCEVIPTLGSDDVTTAVAGTTLVQWRRVRGEHPFVRFVQIVPLSRFND